MTNPGGTTPSNAATLTVNAIAAPVITVQPANQVVFEGQSATFSVTATGASPLSYQWQRDGADIAGATNSSHTTPATTLADDGATFLCQVTNPGGTTPSNAATLTVNAGTGLQVLYSFEEGSGATVNDVSGIGVPLNLTIANPGAVTWITGGLSLDSATLLSSAGPANKVISSVQASNEITVEAWVKAGNDTQTGPARMVTVSQNSSSRNVTLGQAGDAYDARVRTTTTTNNGTPALMTATGQGTTSLRHVVYTRDAPGNARVYVDGIEVAAATAGGDLSNWDAGFALGLGNELSQDRPWLGEFHRVAIFSRALTSTEVAQNFSDGPAGGGGVPFITQHPADQAVFENDTATFGVQAVGADPLAYQWQRDSSDIAGATGTTYTTPATTLSDNGAVFQCLVSNPGGSTLSNPATLTVSAIGAPSITQHPADQVVFENETATFDVVAAGPGPLSYQWQRDGIDIVGATSATYTTPATTPSDNGATFQCLVSNAGGSTLSSAATLTVNAIGAPSITQHPADQTVVENQSATFSVAAAGAGPLSYQWQRDGGDIPGATASTHTTPAPTLADNGATFRCLVSNASGTAPSNAATLSVNQSAPIIVTQPQYDVVAEGEIGVFSVVAVGTSPLSYQWQLDGVDISGATASSYSTPSTTAAADGTVYTCQVTNSLGADATTAAPLIVRTVAFPGALWDTRTPEESGLDAVKLQEFADATTGPGIVVRDGYVVKEWGNQTSKVEWASASKPVLSTMLFFAVSEGRLSGVDARLLDQGWNLTPEDTPMTFAHLANMTSGYARGEAPGEAWAYNDFAINLYAQSLFDQVFADSPDANTAIVDPQRLGSLQFQDGPIIDNQTRRLNTTVRDFARIGWFWFNKGSWNGQQLLPRSFFDDYMHPAVPGSLPRTTSFSGDYLGVGSYGGPSDQSSYGPGIYGFNWWFNRGQQSWPDAPVYAFQANGHWNGEVLTVIPSLGMVAAWKGVNNGSESFPPPMNDLLKILVESVSEIYTSPPAPPSNISLINPTQSTVQIDWLDNSDDEQGFYLYRSTTNTKPATYDLLISPNQTSVVDFGLTCETTHYYWLEAFNNAGVSSDISANIATGTCTSGLQVLYSFEEGSGATVNDVSGIGVPLNLTIANPGAVTWITGGLSLDSATLLSSAGPANKVISSVQASNEITVEAWVKAGNDTQTGPARMVTVSQNSSSRNVTLGQAGDAYDARVRTTTTTNNGTPALVTASGQGTTSLRHVVFTRDAPGNARVYVDGVEVAASVIAGDLSNWDAGFAFGLGNELSQDRPWLGEFHRVAIYSKALTPAEVAQNFANGPAGGGGVPFVTVQPANQAVFEGQSATFNVTATGASPLSYQWQRDGADIAGATNSSYTTPATTLADDGATFLCQVTNPSGTTPSNAATLTVNAIAAPVITVQPANQVVFENQSATFSVTATGASPLSYQWQRDGADIAGATNSSYTTPATTLADDGATFLCQVTNPSGTTPSNAATLTVNAGTGLQVLYSFEEGSGATVNDVSGIGVPLNLTIANPGAVTWITGGLSLDSATLLSSAGPANKVISSVQASNEITVEAWVKAGNDTQTGPARMVTVSQNSSSRNVTLGQAGDAYDARVRTTTTTNNGTPALVTASGQGTTSLRHVVFTRDAPGNARVYVDGVEVAASVIAGDLSNWDAGFAFGLGNELSQDRPWLGEFHLVAIYSRALTSTEVAQNFADGPAGGGPAKVLMLDKKADGTSPLPTHLNLTQNFPNPFNLSTQIEFRIPASSAVTIRIYDLRGTLVRTLVDEQRPAGVHRIEWDGKDAKGKVVGSGAYIYRLASGALVDSKLMILVK